MTHLAPLVTTFLRDHLPVEQGASPHTCEAYAHASRLLFAFAGERLGLRPSQLALEQIDAPLVTAFLAHLEDVRGNGATTRNARLAAVQALMHFVEYRVSSALNQVGEIRAIPYKRHDDRLVRHLTADEVRAVLDARALDGDLHLPVLRLRAVA